MTFLSLTHVEKRFPNGVIALNEFNWEVKEGEFAVVVGPNGCGKTTLLRLIAGLDRPTSGLIRMNDCRVAMVFQNSALHPHLAVRENLALGAKLRRGEWWSALAIAWLGRSWLGRGFGLSGRSLSGRSLSKLGREIEELAERLGLSDLLDRRADGLSGGERQRVAIGRALLARPNILLLDEPLGSVDPWAKVELLTHICRLHEQEGLTTVYVTHDPSEAMRLGDRLLVMRDGKCSQIGTPEDLLNTPADPFVSRFLDGCGGFQRGTRSGDGQIGDGAGR